VSVFSVSGTSVYCDAEEKGAISRATSGYFCTHARTYREVLTRRSVPGRAEAVAPPRPEFFVKRKIYRMLRLAKIKDICECGASKIKDICECGAIHKLRTVYKRIKTVIIASFATTSLRVYITQVTSLHVSALTSHHQVSTQYTDTTHRTQTSQHMQIKRGHQLQNTSHTNISMKMQLEPPNLREY
jgi:hypothetical protein